MQSLVVVPEGCAGARHRGDHRWPRRPTSAKRAVDGRAGEPRGASGCPPRPAATPRATCSRRPTPFRPKQNALGLIDQMVDALAEAARRRGPRGARPRSWATRPHEVLTVASILEYEANRPEDYRRSRACIYNRLREGHDAAAGLDGRLRQQALGRRVDHRPRSGRDDSPYNTYKHPGCRPARSGRPARRRSRRRSTPRTATGSTSSRHLRGRRRPGSPTTLRRAPEVGREAAGVLRVQSDDC